MADYYGYNSLKCQNITKPLSHTFVSHFISYNERVVQENQGAVIVPKNDVVSYWIKDSRDFGIAMKHRTMRISLDRGEVSQQKMIESIVSKISMERYPAEVNSIVKTSLRSIFAQSAQRSGEFYKPSELLKSVSALYSMPTFLLLVRITGSN